MMKNTPHKQFSNTQNKNLNSNKTILEDTPILGVSSNWLRLGNPYYKLCIEDKNNPIIVQDYFSNSLLMWIQDHPDVDLSSYNIFPTQESAQLAIILHQKFLEME